MKKRKSFVSNSSSASFILKIETKEPSSQFTILKTINNLYYCNFREEDNRITQLDSFNFEIFAFTPMYNNVYDIPPFMRDVYLDHILNGETFKNVELEIDDA